MTERELRRELGRFRAPDEAAAQERGRRVVQAAYAEHAPRQRQHFRPRLALALAVLAVLGALGLTSPGQAVLDSVREAVGINHARPALFSLPARGSLLVTTSDAAWVVNADGSKRRLGTFSEASWSPFGRFVVATRENELAALEPDGDVRWTLARPDIRFPRWGGSTSDTRIAYLSGDALRVVAGDGTGDRLLAGGVAPVAPAWRPGSEFVLAFARPGTVRVVNVATGALLWKRSAQDVRKLTWSSDGRLLLVRRPESMAAVDARGRTRFERAAPLTAAALSPTGTAVAFVQRVGDQSSLWLIGDGSAARRVFNGRGSFQGLSWSPDGRWILVGWRAADQWLFFSAAGVHAIRGVSDISRQFGGFPAVAGWCCASEP